MSGLKLVLPDNPILRQQAQPILSITTLDWYWLAQDMFLFLEEVGGIGLAAPQIDSPFQMFVINHPAFLSTVCLNPTYKRHMSSKIKESTERCLSLPGVVVKVPRYTMINIRYFDVYGIEHQSVKTGISARIFQHECDHVHGKLITDYL